MHITTQAALIFSHGKLRVFATCKLFSRCFCIFTGFSIALKCLQIWFLGSAGIFIWYSGTLLEVRAKARYIVPYMLLEALSR